MHITDVFGLETVWNVLRFWRTIKNDNPRVRPTPITELTPNIFASQVRRNDDRQVRKTALVHRAPTIVRIAKENLGYHSGMCENDSSVRSIRATRDFGPAEWGLSSLLALTWGSSFLLIAVAIDHFDPSLVPFGRSLAGAVALACIRGSREAIPRGHWPRIAVLGLVWMALPFWLFPLAERTVTSGIAGMMNGGLPVVTALVTALWVRRVPSKQRVLAIVIGFVGIATIAAPAIQSESQSGESVADFRGIALLLAAVMCYAVATNIARPLQAEFAPARLLLRVQFAAALWSLPLAIFGLNDSTFSLSSFVALVVLGVIGTGLAFVAFGVLLERTGITRAMIPTYFTPVVGLVLGALFRDEHIAALSVVGMLIVILSAWMTSKPDDRDVLI